MEATFDEYLHQLYFARKLMYGRDKLYKHIQMHRPDLVAQGLSRRYVMDWLRRQEVHQLFMPARKMREIQSTVAKAPFQVVGMDLLDMRSLEKDGHKWLLTAIDLFSKKAYAVPLKAKTAEEVVRGLGLLMFGGRRQFVINKHGDLVARAGNQRRATKPQMARLPHVLRSDNGPEFQNDLLTSFLNKFALLETNKPVKQVFGLPYKPQSNGQVERFNGILKRQLKMISVQHANGDDWVRLLPEVLSNYNNSWSRVIKSTPNAVERAFLETGATETTYENIKQAVRPKNQRVSPLAAKLFEVGDVVRVKLDWDKAAGLAWSRDVFAVASVRLSTYGPQYRHTQYRLMGEEGEMVPGVFYNDQLQLVQALEQGVEAPVKYIVDRLIKPKVDDGVQVYEVKWQGYRQHTDEPRADLLRDVPHLVRRFEAQHEVRWPSVAEVRRNVQPAFVA